MDVASSSFGESQTVFGGESNLHRALDNVVRQYQPALVTVATTCLAETIGEDIGRLLRSYDEKRHPHLPVVSASTPSFKDGHVEGFHAMVRALVDTLATQRGPQTRSVNILPPILSPADLRHLREIAQAYALPPTILPDYADTLDGVILDHYCPAAGWRHVHRGDRRDATGAGNPRPDPDGQGSRVPVPCWPSGAPRSGFWACPSAFAPATAFAMPWLRSRVMPCPSGYKRKGGDSSMRMPMATSMCSARRIAVYGDPELVAGLAGFLAEIGARPVLCATGARNRALRSALGNLPAGSVEEVLEDTDFGAIEAAAAAQARAADRQQQGLPRGARSGRTSLARWISHPRSPGRGPCASRRLPGHDAALRQRGQHPARCQTEQLAHRVFLPVIAPRDPIPDRVPDPSARRAPAGAGQPARAGHWRCAWRHRGIHDRLGDPDPARCSPQVDRRRLAAAAARRGHRRHPDVAVYCAVDCRGGLFDPGHRPALRRLVPLATARHRQHLSAWHRALHHPRDRARSTQRRRRRQWRRDAHGAHRPGRARGRAVAGGAGHRTGAHHAPPSSFGCRVHPGGTIDPACSHRARHAPAAPAGRRGDRAIPKFRYAPTMGSRPPTWWTPCRPSCISCSRLRPSRSV
jgi:nitrogenase molybdenum-iron protein NifN